MVAALVSVASGVQCCMVGLRQSVLETYPSVDRLEAILQLSTELRRNVDLHVVVYVLEQMLVHMRSAHRTRRECSLTESGA
jgi:hypothetical protein